MSAQGFAHAPALQSLGYREALAHLEGKISREDALAQFIAATHRYAKRQMTWFRANPRIHWLEVDFSEKNYKSIENQAKIIIDKAQNS